MRFAFRSTLVIVGMVVLAPAGGTNRHAPEAPVLGVPGELSARLEPMGARLRVDEHEATLRLAAVGRGAVRSEIEGPGVVSVDGAEVRTARGPSLVEWWRGLPSGLEHGIDLAERPAGDGELTLELAVGGALHVAAQSDDAVALVDGAGVAVATYAHLVVLDADGVRVPARLATRGTRIAIAIDDRGARYPLVVDPLVGRLEATFAPTGADPSDAFGDSVAVTLDGSRAIVGMPNDTVARPLVTIPSAGTARVFVRVGTTWTEEATLRAADADAGDLFGSSVSISSDGSVALVGVPGDDTARGMRAGSARIFTRSGSTWVEGDTLTDPAGAADDRFGTSVSLSGDGRVAFVGVPVDDLPGLTDAGSVHVFSQTGSAPWVHDQTLTASVPGASDLFGQWARVSRDGTRAVVSAHHDSDAATGGVEFGSARVFVRGASTWTEEATLVTPMRTNFEHFGVVVAISADGSRVVGVVGNTMDAHVFSRTGTTWSHEALLDVPGLGLGVDENAAISDDGTRILLGTPDDSTAPEGSLRLFVRTRSTWAEDLSLRAPGLVAGDGFGRVAAISGDGGRAFAGCPEIASSTGRAFVFTLLSSNGTACRTDAECDSGFCTDGVCCNTRCGSGASDCQACSNALTGRASGTCGALSATRAPMVTCRAATGACDAAETCSASSTTCPADALAPATTVCRAAAGACDVAETCSGTAAACPVDTIAAGGTECRAAAGSCDVGEVCDGASPVCPGDAVVAGGTECRASRGACDPSEQCDGASPACPGDVLLPAGAVCGAGVGDCALPATCTGAAPACPSAGVRPAGTPCRAASGPCDVEDVCDGSSQLCPNGFAPDTTACGPAPSGACDAPDHCSGTSLDCVPVFLVGMECRAAASTCDVAEVCGAAADCPSDVLAPAGTSCRASTDACDPAEVCDGTANVCPSDTTSCGDAGARDGGVPDASVDASAPIDASVPDGGLPPTVAGGCACRVRGPGRASLPVAVWALLLGLALRRGRR